MGISHSIDGLVLFDYREGRGRHGPVEILKDFKGYPQTDGYAVYDIFKQQKDITVLHCMGHARRMFYEARDNDKATAEYALEQIGLLYNIECKAKRTIFYPAAVIRTTRAGSCTRIRSIRQMDERSVYAGANVWYLMINNYYYGTLMYTDGWVFHSNSNEMKELADLFGEQVMLSHK